MHRPDSGYSLTEILAVVLVLSLAAAATIPNLSATDEEKLELAVDEFAQAMRFARSEAIRTGEPHGFRRQGNARRIRVFSVDTTVSPWAAVYDVNHPITKRLYDIDLDDHPFARADSVESGTGWSGVCDLVSYVWFDAMGVPRCLEPNTVLVDAFVTDFTLGNHTRTLVVDGITGRVHVQ